MMRPLHPSMNVHYVLSKLVPPLRCTRCQRDNPVIDLCFAETDSGKVKPICKYCKEPLTLGKGIDKDGHSIKQEVLSIVHELRRQLIADSAVVKRQEAQPA